MAHRDSTCYRKRLKIWDGFIGVAKEETKGRVLDAFGKHLKEIVRKWNNNHSDKCEYTRVFIELFASTVEVNHREYYASTAAFEDEHRI